jgi:hypothetical protein
MSVSIPSGTYNAVSLSPFAALASVGQACWGALVRIGELRATGALRRLASEYELTDPALARQLRKAADDGLW